MGEFPKWIGWSDWLSMPCLPIPNISYICYSVGFEACRHLDQNTRTLTVNDTGPENYRRAYKTVSPSELFPCPKSHLHSRHFLVNVDTEYTELFPVNAVVTQG
jgi:hypothetical protein